MSFTWADDITDATDLQDHSLWVVLETAARERYIVATAANPSDLATLWDGVNAFGAAGTEIGAATHDDGSKNCAWMYALQVALPVGNFVPRKHPDGTAFDYNNQTFSPLSKLGTVAVFRQNAGYSNQSWRRKKPRQILTIGDTVDRDGNTVADGHVAYLYTPNIGAPDGVDGGIFVYNGTSHTWSQNQTLVPDVLDSELAAPFACAAGPSVRGDFLGPWIPTEIRDVIKQMLWLDPLSHSYTDFDYVFWDGVPQFLSGGTGYGAALSPAPLAIAEAMASASWPTGYGGAIGGISAAVNTSPTQPNVYSYYSYLYSVQWHGTMSFPYASGFQSTVEFYAAGQKLAASPWTPATVIDYDSTGTGLAEGKWTKVFTQTAFTGTSLDGQISTITQPPFAADPGLGSNSFAYKGHRLTTVPGGYGNIDVLMKFDVTGGFSYV